MKDKKEQPEQQEKTLIIDITPTRGLLILLALVLVTAACLGTLAWGRKKASAAPAAPAVFFGMRKYYLTKSAVDGNEALTACAPGYHMASLWEILDASNLEYNTSLGFTRDDSGASSPTYIGTWVRTGWGSSTTSGAGRDNCAAWTSDDSDHNGTMAYLPRDWISDLEDMHVWEVNAVACDTLRRVWCMED